LRFWDSSAVAPLLVSEHATGDLLDAYAADPSLVVWWGTEIECVSAISRRERMAESAEDTSAALDRLDELRAEWDEIEPTESIRRTARRLLRTHPLRAADALQLAAALNAAGDDPASLDVVTLDYRLIDAARREGFRVLPQQQV
jgi:predicted nucleic acid-binding protein